MIIKNAVQLAKLRITTAEKIEKIISKFKEKTADDDAFDAVLETTSDVIEYQNESISEMRTMR